MVSSFAGKYARALLDVAAEQGQVEGTGKELEEFARMLKECEELGSALANPAFPIESRRGIIRRLAERAPLSRIVVNLLLLLLERNRINRFAEILGAYQALLDQRQGVVKVSVSTARALDPSEESRLRETVSRMTGKRLKVDYQVDDSLIGGLRMQIGSTVFDGSIRSQLQEIRRQIMGR